MNNNKITSVSGPFGYASSRQFNYAKFQNEPVTDESGVGGPVAVKSNPNLEHLDLSRSELVRSDQHRSWPMKSGHTKVYRRESNEKPLIDLSDDSGASVSEKTGPRPSTSSEISSLFDSLLSSNSSQYGNLELPQPLIRDSNTPPDPFEINPAYQYMAQKPTKPSDLDVKPKRTPPPRPKPIVYRRTTSIESQHSTDSWQSFSPPKCTGIKLPPEYRKRDNLGATPSDSSSVNSAQSIPAAQKADPLDKKAFFSAGNSPLKQPSPPKSQSTKAALEELFSKAKPSVPSDKNLLKSDNLRHERERSASGQQSKNVDKAFDWLNDALNNFQLKKSGKSGSDPVLAKTVPSPYYDQVPDDRETTSPSRTQIGHKQQYLPGQYPVQYCQVPMDSANNGLSNNMGNLPQYDAVPQFEDPSDVKLPTVRKDSIYSPQSTTSTYSDWGDDFDDEFDDLQQTVELSSPPPPLPSRDYGTVCQGNSNSNADTSQSTTGEPHRQEHHRANIFPIVQDGNQLSHTHYFLIPAKGEERSEKATAAVRPFSVHGNHMSDSNNSQDSSGHRTPRDYQNVEELRVLPRELCKDPRAASSSRSGRNSRSSEDLYRRQHSMEASTSAGHSWGAQDVDLSQSLPHQHRKAIQGPSNSNLHHADSLERGINAQRDKIDALQQAVIGITDEECYAALCHCHGNTEKAVKHLKTEQLFRLGLAPRDHCYRLLQALKWNLELASSVMLDEYKSSRKVSMESAV